MKRDISKEVQTLFNSRQTFQNLEYRIVSLGQKVTPAMVNKMRALWDTQIALEKDLGKLTGKSIKQIYIQVMGKAPESLGGLGIAPLVVAGVVIAGVGVLGWLWRVQSHAKLQKEYVKLSEAVRKGEMTSTDAVSVMDKLEKKIEAEGRQKGFLGDISGTAKWLAIGGIAFLLATQVLPMLKKGSN